MASPHGSAFAKLRSLTKLVLDLGDEKNIFAVANMVDALGPLKGLAELTFNLCCEEALVPASLGQLQTLRSLELGYFRPCALEAGCLDLPNLLSLTFDHCHFVDAEGLPGASALRSLRRIEFLCCQGPRFFDSQLVQLRHLQHMIFETGGTRDDGVELDFETTGWLHGGGACPWLSRLPADMGSLSSTLQKVSFSGHRLSRFPLALTQLVALEHLDATYNAMTELPAAITALSRLTELMLGRWDPSTQLSGQCPLDARALGDLSGFPRYADCTLPSARSCCASQWWELWAMQASRAFTLTSRILRPRAPQRSCSSFRRSSGTDEAACSSLKVVLGSWVVPQCRQKVCRPLTSLLWPCRRVGCDGQGMCCGGVQAVHAQVFLTRHKREIAFGRCSGALHAIAGLWRAGSLGPKSPGGVQDLLCKHKYCTNL